MAKTDPAIAVGINKLKDGTQLVCLGFQLGEDEEPVVLDLGPETALAISASLNECALKVLGEDKDAEE